MRCRLLRLIAACLAAIRRSKRAHGERLIKCVHSTHQPHQPYLQVLSRCILAPRAPSVMKRSSGSDPSKVDKCGVYASSGHPPYLRSIGNNKSQLRTVNLQSDREQTYELTNYQRRRFVLRTPPPNRCSRTDILFAKEIPQRRNNPLDEDEHNQLTRICP
jgi:hypothetical protein